MDDALDTFVQPLQPTRDPGATVADLLEVLLNKGVVLNVDLLIAVADIPLIGVSLKAALAGIETMLEFGMMRQWDEQTRAWAQRSLARDVPFQSGENLVLRMSGSWFELPPANLWHPAIIYLTDRRVIAFRREPPAVLTSVPLQAISGARVVREPTFAGEHRRELRISLGGDDELRFTAEEPERFVTRLDEHRARSSAVPALDPSRHAGPVWFKEARATGSVWRAGTATLESGHFRWKGPLDSRPAVSLDASDLTGAAWSDRTAPPGCRAFVIESRTGTHLFASDRTDLWLRAMAAREGEAHGNHG